MKLEADNLNHAQILDMLDGATETINAIRGVRNRPILGGPFGSGQYCLSSLTHALHGLDEVWYFVREANSGALISYGATKDAALTAARKMLALFSPLDMAQYIARVQARKDAAEAEEQQRIKEAQEEVDTIRKQSSKVRSIPKRRKEIFDASEGKCHYCETVLTLDGKWHIEHKMPKALMGGNEPGNLVASCVTCNHRKRDKTDVEFKAQLAREAK